MPARTFLTITPYNGTANDYAGESPTVIFNPYSRARIVNPIELLDWSVSSDQMLDFAQGGTGAGSGKITFDALSTMRRVDKMSQRLFNDEAAGTVYKYLDLLFANPDAQPPSDGSSANSLRPFLSYRFGFVAVSRIAVVPDFDGATVRETVDFEFAQWLIGYQARKTDGTFGPFAATGWDRVRNVALSGSNPPPPIE